MENLKMSAINKQKKIIADLRENFSSETSTEKAIEKLNIIVDDYEKDKNLITKENIHLYYEFMSDENLKQNESLITKVLDDRFKQVCFNLGVTVDVIQNNAWYTTYINQYFGVKDTLKPINEYIEEIKASSEYKAYIEKTKIKLD